MTSGQLPHRVGQRGDRCDRHEQLIIPINKEMLLVNVALLTALALSFLAQWLNWFKP